MVPNYILSELLARQDSSGSAKTQLRTDLTKLNRAILYAWGCGIN